MGVRQNKLMNTVSALDPDSRDIVDPNAQFGDDERYLIGGVDSRIGANNEMAPGTTTMRKAPARQHREMLVNIPAKPQTDVVAVSFRVISPSPHEVPGMGCRDGSTGRSTTNRRTERQPALHPAPSSTRPMPLGDRKSCQR